ncbi:unnamed protein product [Diatraea saccharalis]|uniref:Uncharacterized protein n=1 Tax=Diatraea saccharalis TaxID=40085 RepID=A0A9N9R5D5_9NEOP|nr:unnamed protein product [Diatraea saccharalis]
MIKKHVDSVTSVVSCQCQLTYYLNYNIQIFCIFQMFCIQETESPHTDPFSNNDQDPLSNPNQSESSDDEPSAKRLKTSFNSPSLNLKVYQIPAFNTPQSLSIFPTAPTTSLPKFVNNPLNLANPLALNNSIVKNANNIVKNLQSRYSLPAKLTITPVQTPNKTETGEVVRYKKNGEIAKKRGPPKGYKRKPKVDLSMSLTNMSNVALLQVY